MDMPDKKDVSSNVLAGIFNHVVQRKIHVHYCLHVIGLCVGIIMWWHLCSEKGRIRKHLQQQ